MTKTFKLEIRTVAAARHGQDCINQLRMALALPTNRGDFYAVEAYHSAKAAGSMARLALELGQ